MGMDIWIDRHSERYTHGQTRHALYLYRILCLLKSKTSKHLTSFYTSPYIACCLVSAHLVFIATLLVHFHYFSAHQKKYVPDRNKDLQLTDPRTHRWTHPNGVLYFQLKINQIIFHPLSGNCLHVAVTQFLLYSVSVCPTSIDVHG